MGQVCWGQQGRGVSGNRVSQCSAFTAVVVGNHTHPRMREVGG